MRVLGLLMRIFRGWTSPWTESCWKGPGEKGRHLVAGSGVSRVRAAGAGYVHRKPAFHSGPSPQPEMRRACRLGEPGNPAPNGVPLPHRSVAARSRRRTPAQTVAAPTLAARLGRARGDAFGAPCRILGLRPRVVSYSQASSRRLLYPGHFLSPLRFRPVFSGSSVGCVIPRDSLPCAENPSRSSLHSCVFTVSGFDAPFFLTPSFGADCYFCGIILAPVLGRTYVLVGKRFLPRTIYTADDRRLTIRLREAVTNYWIPGTGIPAFGGPAWRPRMKVDFLGPSPQRPKGRIRAPYYILPIASPPW